MNKHIIGFILFNLIVGTTIIVAALFYEIPKFDSVIVPVTSEAYTHSCWKSNKRYENKLTSAKVSQAIFDIKSHELKTELFVQSNVNSLKDVKMVLHFFVKDGDSTRYLATENLTDKKMDMKGIYDFSERRITKATFLITSSYDWLDDLKSRENLYVVPEIISNSKIYGNYTPVFNEANATPVTLAQ